MWFAVLTFLLASCGTAKQVTYFQDIRPGSDDSIRVVSEMRLMPDDKLSIVVSSKNQELALLFNLPTVSYRMGQASTTSTNTNGQVSAYTVDSDGEIDFPVLGKIKVAGMTREEVARYVKGELISNNLLKDPVVTVDFLNLYVSVLGEVSRPGRYALDRDKMTVLDVLSLAGDLTIQGQREHVYVLRGQGGKQTSYELNLCSLEELYASPVYYMQQGDVVYVSPIPMRKRQTTVNGNNVLSISFWMSVASLAMSVATFLGLRYAN